jgi:hypothetical protein
LVKLILPFVIQDYSFGKTHFTIVQPPLMLFLSWCEWAQKSMTLVTPENGFFPGPFPIRQLSA